MELAENFARVYALDESGRVWEYDFNHRMREEIT